MSMEYQTHDGNDVPPKVADTFDTTPWNDTSDLVDPQNVRVERATYGDMWVGQVDSSEQYVSDYGNATPHHHFDPVRQVDSGVAQPSVGEPIYYGDDVTVVHHDHYHEHVTKVIVVTAPHERVVLGSRSGVVWAEPQYSAPRPADLSKNSDALELASSLLDASTGIEALDCALDGWHSSMEKSEQSELINALSSGNVPRAWADDDAMFPYAVRFGDTNNVCAVNASVHGTEQFAETVSEMFDGARAQPAHGGFN